MDLKQLFFASLEQHQKAFSTISKMQEAVLTAGRCLIDALCRDNRLLVCGNGGSAADSQHFAAELVGRFEMDRSALPAIALTTDTSILTAVANDYGYGAVFERQVVGIGRAGDVLIGLSTSGDSENIIRAVKTAKSLGLQSIGLLGRGGGRLKSLVDISIMAPGETTARIQEVHSFILHYWASVIERSRMAQPRVLS